LMPLSELTAEIVVPEKRGLRKVNLADMLKKFSNRHRERVTFLTKPEMRCTHGPKRSCC
jgi:hypothetical protein